MMKKTLLFSLFIVSGLWNISNAQSPQSTEKTNEVWKKNGYELTVINQDATFDPELKARMVKTFFEVYPKLSKEYNPKTAKAVTFVIDTAYKGVAEASANRIVFSSHYMTTHPKDIDVVTHEAMHVVQDYGNSVGPGWLTEGIADFARFKYGVDNPGANWSLPMFNSKHSYENSYRIAARFLVWVEKSSTLGIVKALNAQLANRSYTDQSWKNLSGKTLEELWKSYTLNPAI